MSYVYHCISAIRVPSLGGCQQAYRFKQVVLCELQDLVLCACLCSMNAIGWRQGVCGAPQLWSLKGRNEVDRNYPRLSIASRQLLHGLYFIYIMLNWWKNKLFRIISFGFITPNFELGSNKFFSWQIRTLVIFRAGSEEGWSSANCTTLNFTNRKITLLAYS